MVHITIRSEHRARGRPARIIVGRANLSFRLDLGVPRAAPSFATVQ